MYIALNELTKALFGIDLDKWGQWFEDIFTGVFDRVMAKVREWIAKVKELMSPFTSWYERNSVPIPTPAYAVDTADRYRQAYSAPPLLANPQSASAAPTAPQQVNVVFSGEIKAPPGSTIDTRVEGGNARGRPDVGYSMRPETNY